MKNKIAALLALPESHHEEVELLRLSRCSGRMWSYSMEGLPHLPAATEPFNPSVRGSLFSLGQEQRKHLSTSLSEDFEARQVALDRQVHAVRARVRLLRPPTSPNLPPEFSPSIPQSPIQNAHPPKRKQKKGNLTYLT